VTGKETGPAGRIHGPLHGAGSERGRSDKFVKTFRQRRDCTPSKGLNAGAYLKGGADMLSVKLGNSVMVVDTNRFHFGDGEWVVAVYGDDLFS
jgi:hypothetical protein